MKLRYFRRRVPGATASSPLDRSRQLARYHWLAMDNNAAMATIERAVATVPADPPTQERARVLAVYGRLLMLAGHHSQAMTRCREAIAVARQAGARAAEGYALTAPGSSLGDLRDVRDSYRGNPRGQAPAGALLSRKP